MPFPSVTPLAVWHVLIVLLRSPAVLLIVHHVTSYFSHHISLFIYGHQWVLFVIMSAPINLRPVAVWQSPLNCPAVLLIVRFASA